MLEFTVTLIVSYKLDFSSFAIWNGFSKFSHVRIVLYKDGPIPVSVSVLVLILVIFRTIDIDNLI